MAKGVGDEKLNLTDRGMIRNERKEIRGSKANWDLKIKATVQNKNL